MSRVNTWLDAAASVAVLVGVGLFVIGRLDGSPRSAPSSPSLPTGPVSLENVRTIGSDSASVVILEFTDFTCPFCAKFNDAVLPLLNQKFIQSARVRLVTRQLPSTARPGAWAAARVAACASTFDDPFALRNRLFEIARSASEADILGLGQRAPSQIAGGEGCLANSSEKQVAADVEQAKLLGVTATPSFLVGLLDADGAMRVRKRLTGARPFQEFEMAIESVIRER